MSISTEWRRLLWTVPAVFTSSFSVVAISDPAPFRYPAQPLVRRHGPAGYASYRSYRPWLRDEFSFRCVYCLVREQWGRATASFDLEHFVPQVLAPERSTRYDNLLYACRSCNVRKGKRSVPDPSDALTAQSVRVYPDGTLAGITADAERIIRVLCLNSAEYKRWRRIWIRIIELAEADDPELLQELMGYPQDLPDLRTCRVPENSRPTGVDESHFQQRERGELAETYFC